MHLILSAKKNTNATDPALAVHRLWRFLACDQVGCIISQIILVINNFLHTVNYQILTHFLLQKMASYDLKVFQNTP